MPVREKMEVAVGMAHLFVTVDMVMNQVYFQEKIQVVQDFSWRSLGHDGMSLFHDRGPIGDVFQD